MLLTLSPCAGVIVLSWCVCIAVTSTTQPVAIRALQFQLVPYVCAEVSTIVLFIVIKDAFLRTMTRQLDYLLMIKRRSSIVPLWRKFECLGFIS